jgi:hypothetical protein
MAPPKFADLSKATNDLLGKDYPVGIASLEVNTTTEDKTKFTVSGQKENGFVATDLKAKFNKENYVFTQTWSTANVLTSQLEVDAAGLKMELLGSLSDKHNLKGTVEYKQDNVFARTGLDLFKGPLISGDVVVGNNGYLLGAEVAYQVADAKVNKYQVALGYVASDYSLGLSVLNNKVFTGTYHHKVNAQLEACTRAIYGSVLSLELGSKYQLDGNAFIKVLKFKIVQD